MSVQQARGWLRAASSVVVLTGAGISAESGVPIFRGSGGLWKQYRPEDLATPEVFRKDPRTVWEWYDWRRCMIAKAAPNAGHHALVELEKRKSSFTLVTQNVDGLHEKAGNQRPLKLHGDIWGVRCLACGREYRDERTPLPELPPRCECGGMLRPAVVWFGEPLHDRTWWEAERAACSTEIFLVVGTSAVVYPAAGLIWLAKAAGARIVEINPEETPLSSDVDCSLRGRSGELLPRLVE
jgi:NAD-dependent deacetylase